MTKPATKRISTHVLAANLQLCEIQTNQSVYMSCDFMARVFRELLEHRKKARHRAPKK